MAYQNGSVLHDPIESARNAIHGWLRKMSGQEFEEFVVQLLTLRGASRVERTGGAGDGGIDGIGNMLDFRFAFQAKRWDRDVPPKEVVNFVGALTSRGLTSGYFFTSSGYTRQAREAADKAQEARIEVKLYDGNDIADTMIENRFGVREVKLPVYEFDATWWERRLNKLASAPTLQPPPNRDDKRRVPKRPAKKTAKTRIIWDLCDEGRHPPKEIRAIAEANGLNRKTVDGAIWSWRACRAREILDEMPDASEDDRVAALMKLHIPERVARDHLRRARRG